MEYFHVVFTVPEQVAAIALQNKRELYGILMRASAATLKEVAADPRRLGAEIGFVSVLHTWGQNLLHHPHVHCVVPGGGLAPDGSRWVSCRPGFFLPVKVLGKMFRGKFLDALQRAFQDGRLRFQGALRHLREAREFRARLAACRRKDWVVYSKPPFGGPEQVLKYLARHTHRVAVSNARLLRMADGNVTFLREDYSGGSRRRTMTLAATEFVRRLLLHVLPKGFPRIRHYGLLGNRSAGLARCRELLACAPPEAERDDPATAPSEAGGRRCPVCGSTALRHREATADELLLLAPGRLDSS